MESMMAFRYVFGPVSPAYADEYLFAPRQQGECLAFDLKEGLDLTVPPDADWESLAGSFPAGWQADLIVLYLPYRVIPRALWAVPVPIVGLAPDWNLLWHSYRGILPLCDLVLTDQ